jgi:hypothetical protein
MTRYLTGVLTVIAVGIILIAFGLLSPRTAAFNGSSVDPYGRPMVTDERLTYDPYAVRYAYANAYRPAGQTFDETPAVRHQAVALQREVPAPQRVVTRTVERDPRRDWTKTMLMIGGSTATGAGVGGMIGGKKGALIGAAVGGGASTLYQSTR